MDITGCLRNEKYLLTSSQFKLFVDLFDLMQFRRGIKTTICFL